MEISKIEAPERPLVRMKPAAAHVMKKPAAAPAPEVSVDAAAIDEQASEEEQEETVQEVHNISDEEAADEEPVEAEEDAEAEAAEQQLQSFCGFVHPLLGALGGGCFSKQSYITAKNPTDFVKRLVVAVSSTQSSQHAIVCNRLFRWAMANPQENKKSIMLKRTEFLTYA